LYQTKPLHTVILGANEKKPSVVPLQSENPDLVARMYHRHSSWSANQGFDSTGSSTMSHFDYVFFLELGSLFSPLPSNPSRPYFACFLRCPKNIRVLIVLVYSGE
jgi:hypothetical protein